MIYNLSCAYIFWLHTNIFTKLLHALWS